ncbi:MAG TPA: hypothetical protein VOA41_08290, partial [Candidatus Dormibacteraeota bacterium]|nr:hypothetical protein [Candidatus Dormibacteraeota bacterium]
MSLGGRVEGLGQTRIVLKDRSHGSANYGHAKGRCWRANGWPTFAEGWRSGDSGEGNRDSGLIVISIPDRGDQSSERSDAGRRILQKVITIVKEKV